MNSFSFLIGLMSCLMFVDFTLSNTDCTCTKAAGCCRDYGFYIKCYVENNNTQQISSLLNDCSTSNTLSVSIYKYYTSIILGQLLINIELKSTILTLYIYNSQDNDYFRLNTSTQNTGLLNIFSYARVAIDSKDFFNYFTGLREISLDYLFPNTNEIPSFTNLRDLSRLTAKIILPNPQALDKSVVRGLSNLVYLSLSSSSFNDISVDAFENLPKLTFLDLTSNRITQMQDGIFSRLSNLEQLKLGENGIKTVPNNIFEGLSQLTYLELYENPGFSVKTLLQTRNLRELNLGSNEYTTLDSFVFQQLNKLAYIYLNDNPFTCDCELQWTSLVGQYGISVYYGKCLEPITVLDSDITSKQLYANCSQSQSYQCFNKSITCRSNEVCHDTKNSYFCGCLLGFSLYSTGKCEDIDECIEFTKCENSCVNTEGSFHCVCNDGYKLATNGYDCIDINECEEWNGGCEFGCRNIIGSYECYCEYGHALYNATQCKTDIECELVDTNQGRRTSTDSLEHRFECKGGFNLSIANLVCNNNSQTSISSSGEANCGCTILTPILVTVFFTIIVILVIIGIVLQIYLIKRNLNSKPLSDYPTNTEIVENKPEPEMEYYTMEPAPPPVQPQQFIQPPPNVRKPKKPSNLFPSHPYPGTRQDENRQYINFK